MRVDVVVVTALAEERAAVVAALRDAEGEVRVESDDGEAFVASLGAAKIAVARLLGMGNVGAAAAAREMITAWQPRFVILAGLAAGIRRNAKDLRLGDVVVAEQVVGFELAKITAEGTQRRYQTFRSDFGLLAAAHTVAAMHRAHVGPVLSGEKVVADLDSLMEIGQAWPTAVGVEMEGLGVALAAYRDGCGFLLVKGVSDFADVAKDDRWRAMAAAASARFVLELLRRPPIGTAGPRRQEVERLAPRYLHAVPLPANWADRSLEAVRLGGLMADPNTKVLNIVALGGTGKSTLVRLVAEHAFDAGSRFDSLFWFSFYREEDVELFFLEACRYLVPAFDPVRHESTFERATLLQEVVLTRSVLIVMDGFERMVTVRSGRRGAGRIARRELSSFLSQVMSSPTGTTVAITSRVPLDEFGGLEGFAEEQLPDLTPDSAIAFLRRAGLTGSERALRQVADAYGCHALALTVFVDYVRFRQLEANIGGIDAPTSFPSESTRAERLNALLCRYSACLTDLERSVVSLIATSVRGLTRDELGELVGKAPDGTGALRSLNASQLITLHQDGETVRLDSHPLIKAYFYEALKDGQRHEAHRRLLALARSKAVAGQPTAIDEIQPLLDMFSHAAAMGDVQAAFDTWQDRRVRNRLLWWGNYDTALDLIDRLLGSPAFRSRPNAYMQGFLLDQAGLLLVKLGRPGDALESYQNAVPRLAEHAERQLQTLLHLCETQMEVGLFLDARESLHQANKLFPEVPGFPYFRLLGRQGYLATALESPRHAEQLLTQAIREAEEQELREPGYRCLYLRIRGDLFCSNGLLDAAEVDYRAALALATDERWRFTDYEGHLRRGLGEIACLRSHRTEAKAHFSAALDIARRLGYRWLETETFAATARCHLRIGDLDGAEKDAATANDFAIEGGWIALEADSLLTLAECRLRRRMPADQELETAGDIVSRSGSRPLEEHYLRLRSTKHPHE